ncbi:MAG: GNAT family N-acetyltransferase [Clostridia bacterium]
MKPDVKIEVNNNAEEVESKFIVDSLIKYNLQKSPINQDPPFETINLILKGENGSIIGGLLGALGRSCYYLEYLWIDENYRGLGYGKKLLDEIEKRVKEKGCKVITLNTFSFQAPEFYKKNGYTVFGTLDGFQEGVCRYYLKKDIYRN